METLAALAREIPTFNAILSCIIVVILVRVDRQVRITNGRLTKLETWQTDHNKQDDERHKKLDDAIVRLESKPARRAR